jgi:hypothetical protein
MKLRQRKFFMWSGVALAAVLAAAAKIGLDDVSPFARWVLEMAASVLLIMLLIGYRVVIALRLTRNANRSGREPPPMTLAR